VAWFRWNQQHHFSNRARFRWNQYTYLSFHKES
jgi:hypothetical protein